MHVHLIGVQPKQSICKHLHHTEKPPEIHLVQSITAKIAIVTHHKIDQASHSATLKQTPKALTLSVRAYSIGY
ncbi:MAG: hypothetical protein IT497_10255 [Ottowia sp.]|nr:hypothetical protein [Ottowia sp.]